jgi:hypothetical protein
VIPYDYHRNNGEQFNDCYIEKEATYPEEVYVGGPWRNAVYEITSPVTPPKIPVKYGSCRKDYDGARRLPSGGIKLKATSPREKVQECAKFAKDNNAIYFSIQNGNQCWYRIKTETASFDAEPSDKCTYTDGVFIGQEWANAIYEYIDVEETFTGFEPLNITYAPF